MKKELYIIDAVNLLFRSYYAIGPMLNHEGMSTSALYGFIRSIQKLIKEKNPHYLVAVFDGPDNKKSRQAVYAEYKMHRKGAPEDLFPQFEWADQFCSLAGISTLCFEGVEADDTMASVAVWASKQAITTYLCTSDKDLMQLVGENVFLLHPAKDYMLVDSEKVKELYGVTPHQMLDFLAIMGDASDNIPGLEGFGPKTASSLLQEFGTLDEILKNPDKVKGAKKQEILKTQKEKALMSRELARLDLQVAAPKELSFYELKKPKEEELFTFYQEMKFNSLLKELNIDTPLLNQKKKQKKEIDHLQYHLINDEISLKHLLKTLSQEKEIGLDVETTELAPLHAKLVGIGFCVEPGVAWYVPLNGDIKKEIVLDHLLAFFQKTKAAFFGHNIKYDLHVLQNHGIFVKNLCFDTLLASYLLNPQNRRHNLDELALTLFKKAKIPITDLIGKGKNQRSMLDVEIEQIKEYCCEDIDYTARLKEYFEEKLVENKLDSLFYEIELPLLPILLDMERTGIYLNQEKIKAQAMNLEKELFVLKKEIFEEVGEEFNLSSPKQLSSILFEKLQMKKPSRAKTEYATGASVLEELATEHPIAYKILQFRTLEKLRTTYAEALPNAINPETNRVHCTFNQSVTATGRLSSQNPNLQNIPVRGKEGIAIRSCFEPQKKGWSYLSADYSQIELRLLAHFSEDPELLQAFKLKEDIHAYTASLIFNLPIEMITPQMRSQAKTVNFGILYGQGPFGLSKQLHIPYKEAQDFIKTYFERYPNILNYLESSKESARKFGFAKTLTGRKRPIPELHNKNPMIRQQAERLATNTPLQGTAADLIKMAMIEIDKALLEKEVEGKMILQIHDELIFEIPDKEIPLFERIVKEKMEKVFKLKVPLEVDISIGKNWAEC